MWCGNAVVVLNKKGIASVPYPQPLSTTIRFMNLDDDLVVAHHISRDTATSLLPRAALHCSISRPPLSAALATKILTT